MILQYVKQASTRNDVDGMSGSINEVTEKNKEIMIRYEARDMAEELNATTEEIASVIISISGNMDDASANSNQAMVE